MRLGDRYRLLRLLAEGGFGSLYLAEAEEGLFACKVLRPRGREKGLARSRFLREIHTAQKLAPLSLHIVAPVFWGEQEGLGLYYLMEYLEGHTLKDLLFHKHSYGFQDFFSILEQLCGALGVAHENGVVHRDLKPANVFLQRGAEPSMRVKLLDWGLAKELTGMSSAGTTNGSLGSLRYMPPEQWRNWQVGPTADIYALGVVSYELLTRRPFYESVEPTKTAMREAHFYKEPVPLELCRPDLSYPEGLSEVILQALQKQPRHRYPTTSAFWRALQPFARTQGELCSEGDWDRSLDWTSSQTQ